MALNAALIKVAAAVDALTGSGSAVGHPSVRQCPLTIGDLADAAERNLRLDLPRPLTSRGTPRRYRRWIPASSDLNDIAFLRDDAASRVQEHRGMKSDAVAGRPCVSRVTCSEPCTGACSFERRVESSSVQCQHRDLAGLPPVRRRARNSGRALSADAALADGDIWATATATARTATTTTTPRSVPRIRILDLRSTHVHRLRRSAATIGSQSTGDDGTAHPSVRKCPLSRKSSPQRVSA